MRAHLRALRAGAAAAALLVVAITAVLHGVFLGLALLPAPAPAPGPALDAAISAQLRPSALSEPRLPAEAGGGALVALPESRDAILSWFTSSYVPRTAWDLTRPGARLGSVFGRARQRAHNMSEHPGMPLRQREASRRSLLADVERHDWFSFALRWNSTLRALSLRPALAALPSTGQSHWPATLIQCSSAAQVPSELAPHSSAALGVLYPATLMTYPTIRQEQNHTPAVGAFGSVGKRLLAPKLNILSPADDALHFAQTRKLVHQPSTAIIPVYARCHPLSSGQSFQYASDEKAMIEVIGGDPKERPGTTGAGWTELQLYFGERFPSYSTLLISLLLDPQGQVAEVMAPKTRVMTSVPHHLVSGQAKWVDTPRGGTGPLSDSTSEDAPSLPVGVGLGKNSPPLPVSGSTPKWGYNTAYSGAVCTGLGGSYSMRSAVLSWLSAWDWFWYRKVLRPGSKLLVGILKIALVCAAIVGVLAVLRLVARKSAPPRSVPLPPPIALSAHDYNGWDAPWMKIYHMILPTAPDHNQGLQDRSDHGLSRQSVEGQSYPMHEKASPLSPRSPTAAQASPTARRAVSLMESPKHTPRGARRQVTLASPPNRRADLLSGHHTLSGSPASARLASVLADPRIGEQDEPPALHLSLHGQDA